MPTHLDPQAVTRIVCTSVCTVEGSVMDELFRVRERISRKGDGTLVRGALLYCAGWFVLWLEGPADQVDAARRNAAANPRNEKLEVIHRSTGPATLGVMATVVMTQAGEGHMAFARRIQAVRERSQAMQPADIWRTLAAPLVCPLPSAEHLPRRRIALLSTDDNGPVHLLRNLGDRSGSRVAYQRYADTEALASDVGLAYTDIVASGYALRLGLLSRRALRQQLVRDSLRISDALVVMLGSRPGACSGLAASLEACMPPQGPRPAIYLCGDPQEHAECAALLLNGVGIARGGWIAPGGLESFITNAGVTPLQAVA